MRSIKQQLYYAMQSENPEEFEYLLTYHFREILWDKIEGERTALDLIVRYGKKQFFELVLEELNSQRSKKIPDEMIDYFLDRSVSLAFFYGQMEIMEIALNNNHGVRAKNLNSALTQAIFNRNIEEIKNLIARGACLNAEGWYFVDDKSRGILSTPLSLALTKKSAYIVDFLLKEGAYLFSNAREPICISERRDDIEELFSGNVSEEIDLLLKLAPLKMNLFKAIAEGDIVLLCSTLNQATHDFLSDCDKLIFARSSRGFTPFEEASYKEDKNAIEALSAFIKLSNQNKSSGFHRSVEPLISDEQLLESLQKPVNQEALMQAAARVGERLPQDGLGSPAPNFIPFFTPAESDSEHENYLPSVPISSASSVVEARTASRVPGVSIFRVPAPANNPAYSPPSSSNNPTPSAPSLDEIEREEREREEEPTKCIIA